MSMPTGGSSMNGSSVPNDREVFDITKAEGALAVLRRVHMSTMTPEEKNELRDAVFSVQNGAMSADVKAVEDLFAKQGMTVTAGAPANVSDKPVESVVTQTAAPAPASQGAFGRPVPSFSQAPAKTTESTPTPAAAAQEEPSVSSEEAVQPTPSPDPEPAASTTSTAPVSDPAVRIKEIKKEVNGLVGNPVNLININAEAGREYMNSLLDAMKKVNTGVGSSDMERAMQRLETAFTAVKNLDMDKAPAAAAESVEEEKKAEAEPVVQPVETQISTPEPGPATEPTPTPTPVQTESVSEPVAAVSKPEPEPEPQPSMTTKMASVGETTKQATAPESAPEPEPAVAPETTPAADSAEESVADKKKPFTAVAKEKQLEQIMKEQTESLEKAEGAKAVSSDPLHDPAVTTGLEQLLSEWKLFKSSGIFGTGPSGIDHPLYKKLAPLNMAAVMTGRFEGSSSEIKQNLTEYMSGWRYEEGIIYEPAETFEHYLRRVIRHILDKQKEQ